jgi:hypothetical protein
MRSMISGSQVISFKHVPYDSQIGLQRLQRLQRSEFVALQSAQGTLSTSSTVKGKNL